MKPILITLSQKWPEYLLEILVITIGILGAFALNSWNEDRKFEIEKRQYLQNLHKEFQGNHEKLAFFLKDHAKTTQMLSRLSKLIKPEAQDIDKATFDSLILNMAYIPEYKPISSVATSPFIEQLDDNELKKMLTEWSYNLDEYSYTAKIIYDLYYNAIYPFVGSNYQMKNAIRSRYEGQSSTFRIDQQKLLSSPIFENHVEMKRVNSELMYTRGKAVFENQEDILSYIEQLLE